MYVWEPFTTLDFNAIPLNEGSGSIKGKLGRPSLTQALSLFACDLLGCDLLHYTFTPWWAEPLKDWVKYVFPLFTLSLKPHNPAAQKMAFLWPKAIDQRNWGFTQSKFSINSLPDLGCDHYKNSRVKSMRCVSYKLVNCVQWWRPGCEVRDKMIDLQHSAGQ